MRTHTTYVLIILMLAVLACGQTVPASSNNVSIIPTATTQAIPAGATPTTPPSQSTQTHNILIGMEYVLIDNDQRIRTLANNLAEIGAPVAKHYPEHIEWGVMQPAPDAPIDFHRLDAFVREFQAVGFTDLVVTLKSHSNWASINHTRLNSVNAAPKPEYLDLYANWVSAIVERYDGDGVDDLPGLLYPVRYYEIGTEFSSYEPGPVADYITMLERAYASAHQAYADVQIAHVAFLTASVFTDPTLDIETAWAEAIPPVQRHSLADHRAILARPDIFDLINIHALTDPYEIEAIVGWLNSEMAQQGYSKPIIISDTIPTPFIAYGSATTCDRPPNQMGYVFSPATEDDRCRLADYFQRLVDGDESTVRWTQGFIASDTVKRVVISAEQNVLLINTAFTEDLAWLKLPVVQAGAGTSAWAGMLDVATGERRAMFYAVQQLTAHLDGYISIERLPYEDEGVRLYEVVKGGSVLWIGWYEPGRVILPNDPIPTITITLDANTNSIILEPTITTFGQTQPSQNTLPTANGTLTIELNPTPIYITPHN